MIDIKFSQTANDRNILCSLVKTEKEGFFFLDKQMKICTNYENSILLGVKIGTYINNNKNNVQFDLDINLKDFSKQEVLKIYEGILIGSWEYENHKTTKQQQTFSIMLITNEHITQEESDEIHNLIEATYLTRSLVEMPSNILTPIKLAEIAQSIEGLDVKVEKMTKGGIWEVGKGSQYDPILITCEWKGSSDECIALVGKGVTFDSGGLSLKPPKSMEDMKQDMGGAATVLGIMQAAAKNNLQQRIIGLIPCVENMPSGNALKPGDVITSLSGKTIEVLNTDAEGRLILADALFIAENNYKPKFIIDFATLTGAIHVALGELFGGLFCNNDKLAKVLIDAANECYEPLIRFPMHKKYDKLIDSNIADVCNIQKCGAGAGSITAAQFLQRFIQNTPWVHIDIASTVRTTYENIIGIHGSTGFGVRSVYHLIKRDLFQK
ncbi:MAG: leucyl aminopeptidase [Alphaproteobacteria bacterium]|nr:MAG: leucyl aminopeptidase [Alphaproteobacteria bacterium]